jgi:hypothetical protein
MGSIERFTRRGIRLVAPPMPKRCDSAINRN